MKVQKFVFNPYVENSYILYQEGSGEAVAIDPGSYSSTERKTLTTFLDEAGLSVKIILNTHLHGDHIYGNECLEKKYGCPSNACKLDQIPREPLAPGEKPKRRAYWPFLDAEPVISNYIAEGDKFDVAGLKIETLATPGHSPGSVSFYLPEEKAVFVGDVLEEGGPGSLKFLYSSEADLRKSIAKLLELPAETTVYFGHGDPAKLGEISQGLRTFLER